MAKAKAVEEFGYLEGTGDAKALLIDQVLWALHLHGPFEDPDNGRATALLGDWLEEHGVRVTSTLSAVVRDLASNDWGAYIERDCPATRTYSIALRKGVRPGRVSFPPNPFPDMEQEAKVVPISVKALAEGDYTEVSPDESSGGPDAVAIAVEITGLAAQLARTLPGQLASQRGELPDWVKKVVDENVRLTERVQRLEADLEVARGLADRLLPGNMEQSEDGAAVSG